MMQISFKRRVIPRAEFGPALTEALGDDPRLAELDAVVAISGSPDSWQVQQAVGYLAAVLSYARVTAPDATGEILVYGTTPPDEPEAEGDAITVAVLQHDGLAEAGYQWIVETAIEAARVFGACALRAAEDDRIAARVLAAAGARYVGPEDEAIH